ncbi:sugar ABC transporter ATP-binding protein [Trueperella sp. LYQ143]|uniref:sugar ABC transporter ATP-binding protein n=1 Tax=unclassified Trueperella TaxID=2630174 RepID=UPI0039839346
MQDKDSKVAVKQAQPIVQMTGISIEFPGVKALDGVNFRLFPGEVHAIMGENGAGKSTLIKSLTGVYRPDAGEVLVNGKRCRFNGPGEAEQAGIATVYQEVNLSANLSIGENIMLGREDRGILGINWKSTFRKAHEALKQVGLEDLNVKAPLSSVSLAVQQLIAIARATVVNASVLILDEPTSSLDTNEVERLFDIIRRLRDQGVAILFVSHFLDQVYEISDRITVLRNGRFIGEGVIEDMPRGKMISMMIGQEKSAGLIGEKKLTNVAKDAPTKLAIVDLGRKGMVNPVNFEVRRGEIMGFAGLLGSGRTEVARLIFSADKADSGSVTLNGKALKQSSPLTSLKQGVAYSTENRRDEGVIAALSVRDNITIALQATRGWMKKIPTSEANEISERFIKALGIKTPSWRTPVGSLSGGNQQKVLLARWLATNPEIMILDEPTRGIDISAKTEIMNTVHDLANDGMSIIFISGEMEEVLRVSNRVTVMRDRKQIAQLDNTADLQQADVVAVIAGGEVAQ